MLLKNYFSIMLISLVLLFTGCCLQIPGPGPSIMLANLAVNEGTLNPAFDYGVSKYSVVVPNSTTSITVTATLEDTRAYLYINSEAAVSGQPSSPIPLEVGSNHISVTVQEGHPRTVTITVTRTEPTSWTKQFGSSSNDVAFATAVDAAGHIFVAGWTEGTLEGSNVGSADAFLRKYDTNGNTLWTRQFGSSAFDRAVAVAAYSSGDVVVAGATEGNLEGVSSGAADVFVRKYNTDGDVVWTRQFGSSVGETATAVAIDTLGNVLVAGFTEGDLEGSSFGGEDAFVRKYTIDGSVIWTRQFGTTALDRATAIAIDNTDYIYCWRYRRRPRGFQCW